MPDPFSPGRAPSPESAMARLRVLASAIQQAPDAILILEANPSDEAGRRIVYVNEAFTRLTGYQEEEVLGQTLHFLKGPETDQDALDDIRRAYEEQRPIRKELLNYCKDGSTFWVECDISFVTDDDGTLTHWISILRDVTRRRQAEEALEAITRIQASITDAFFVVDRNWQLTHANRQARKLLADNGDDIIGRDLRTIRSDGDAPFVHVQLRKAQEEQVTTQFEMYDPTVGQWFEVHAYPLDGGLSIYLSDVTQRRAVEQALAESENRFFSMSEMSTVMLWMTGPDKKMSYLNRGLLEFLGLPAHEMLGHGWVDAIHPEDADDVLEQFFSDFDARRSFQFEYRLRRADGAYRWIVAHGSPRFLQDGRFVGYIGSCIDITPGKEAEIAQREMSRRLVEAQETERRRLAHELHDEVGGLLTSLRLSLRLNPATDEAARAELREAEALVDELSGHVREMGLRLRPSMLDDLGLVPALETYCTRYTSTTNVQVDFRHELDPSERFPSEVETAAFRVVQEALTNVARHADVDDVQVLLLRAGDEHDGEHLTVHVIDEGRGFDLDDAREAHSSLGLVGMTERVRLLEGAVEIATAPGEGTRVTAQLPTKID